MEIKEFQEKLEKLKITAYLICNSDDHISEYIPDYFKEISFLTGYTGEGTLLITQNDAYIWVDGRYFIQADIELKGKPIKVMKMGEPNVPTLINFMHSILNEESVLAFNSKMVSTSLAKDIKANVSYNRIENLDLVSEFWQDRPALPYSTLYILEQFYSGKSYQAKLLDVITSINKYNADYLIIPELTSQSWLFNLRANDIKRTPVFLAYTVITPKTTTLYIDERKIDQTVSKYLDENEIQVKPYDEIYQLFQKQQGKTIMIDLDHTNYELYKSIEVGNNIIDTTDPITLLKSIKNASEIKNTRKAQIKDCVTLTKFMYNLKNNFNANKEMTEVSVAEDLYQMRSQNKGFIDLSFDTISAWNGNAAMAHYSPTKENCAKIEGSGLLLVDSGAHYLEGTTDITRTFALGKISEEMKKSFTLVLKAHINLAKLRFMKGCRGINLDVIARAPIWQEKMDYNHGTGHGIGYLLSVHEGPNCFRWRHTKKETEMTELQPGMITSDEPGLYFENKYGIRIESDILVVEDETNEYGTFYKFENLTYVPIDLDAINPKLLNKEEKKWLNDYHKKCYEVLSPKLTEKQKEWLKEYTKEI